jgi:flagellar biosynthesis protein FlhG
MTKPFSLSYKTISTSSQDLLLKSKKKIWSMGGGKGGVGKSFIISNLAITLARMGKKVIIVDLDLGSANLHTCLGIDIPMATITDFFSGRVDSLEKLLVKTEVTNLQFISGANDSSAAANLTEEQHKILLKKLEELPAEYILLDLGAGTHYTTLDYFLLADRPLISLSPEPTAIENSYRFIKSAYFRWIREVENKLGLKSLVEEAMDHKNHLGIKTPHDLLNGIEILNPGLGKVFREEVQKFEVFLVMNQVRTQNDAEIGHAVTAVCKKYFGIETHYVGYLDYDNAVWQAVRKRKSLTLEYPYSSLVAEFSAIARNLDTYERHPQSVLLRTS